MIALPLENSYAKLQRNFVEAIFSGDAPIPSTIRTAAGPACVSRFGVYRNNVMAGLINAVAARYPVVRKLLWEDSFNQVARLYVTAEPPRSPILLEYGESFPMFLRKVGEGIAADYLADIAELEAARTRAYHAADARPVGKDIFGKLPPDQLMDMRLKLHPSVELLKSRFPIVTIWEANLYANDNTISEWKQESVLVARPELQVEVHRLSAGGYEFLAALSDGHSVGAAAAHAMADAADFSLADSFTTLISANVIVGIEFGRDGQPRE